MKQYKFVDLISKDFNLSKLLNKYIDNLDELKTSVEFRKNIENFIRICLNNIYNKNYDQYSWLCATITYWSNLLLNLTGNVFTINIPNPRDCLVDYKTEYDLHITEYETKEVTTIIKNYLLKSDRTNMREIWTYSKASTIIKSFREFKLFLAYISFHQRVIIVYQRKDNEKKYILGGEIIDSNEAEVFIDNIGERI